MNVAPRLSIGLAVYNGANYLGESLDALLGQSLEDFELIISDNASTDDTADICSRYLQQDSRIHYFRQPRNIGLAPNYNFVLEKARGELASRVVSGQRQQAKTPVPAVKPVVSVNAVVAGGEKKLS